MARLGIDFGTTNTVAVIADRGVFSVVSHEARTRAGTIVRDVFPSAILIDGQSGQRWFGNEADRRFGQLGPGRGHVFISSLKRQLRDYAVGGDPVSSAIQEDWLSARSDAACPAMDELLTGFLRALKDSIRASQGLPSEEPLETVITWPANCNGAQRHVTRNCFREAGFEVIDTLNEPTASAIELADCLTAGQKRGASHAPSAVAVFDLGGGTFDASVVWIDGSDFHVLASAGIENLGGDDFDRILLDMFLERIKLPADELSPLTRHALLRQVRSQKETISGGLVRSLLLNPQDFGFHGSPVSIPISAFHDRARPLIAQAIGKLGEVLAEAADREPHLSAGSPLTVYLVGGSSGLPLVAEMVSEAFPETRVVLTDKPFCSVAMGAAISATDRVSYRDVFARHFGVIRLRDHGRTETFDPIFAAGTAIPRKGEPPLEKVAWYHPQHNIGHLRFLECTAVSDDRHAAGDVRAWSDILFPYDRAVPLAAANSLTGTPIVTTDRFADQAVCEKYHCDCDGVITVELHRPACGDSRTYEIFRD